MTTEAEVAAQGRAPLAPAQPGLPRRKSARTLGRRRRSPAPLRAARHGAREAGSAGAVLPPPPPPPAPGCPRARAGGDGPRQGEGGTRDPTPARERDRAGRRCRSRLAPGWGDTSAPRLSRRQPLAPRRWKAAAAHFRAEVALRGPREGAWSPARPALAPSPSGR